VSFSGVGREFVEMQIIGVASTVVRSRAVDDLGSPGCG
jgi:hypothetical protein